MLKVWGVGGLEPGRAALTSAANEKCTQPVGLHLWSQLSAVECNSELMIHFTQLWNLCGCGDAGSIKAGSCPSTPLRDSFWVMICSQAINQDVQLSTRSSIGGAL